MPYPLGQLVGDIAQVQHQNAGFGTGRLVGENLILTAAHVLWKSEEDRNTGVPSSLKGWQVRLVRDCNQTRPFAWHFRRENRVIWYDLERDLALIRLVHLQDVYTRPVLRLRIATVQGNNVHRVEARGYPRASKQHEQPRTLTSALGRLTAASERDPLLLGVDAPDLPNLPHKDWPGMSGSAVLLQDWFDVQTIWIYGVIQEVPANFDGKLRVARLADAWQQDSEFRALLVGAGVDDTDAADPTAVAPTDLESPLKLFVGVPARIDGFVGRDGEFDQLDQILLAAKPAAVASTVSRSASRVGRAALQGLGGVGKTSLAAEYAYRRRDMFAGIWWCPAHTRVGLLTSLTQLGIELGADVREADVETAAKQGLQLLGRQHDRLMPFLLIYDNVVIPDDIADLLPAAGARVLITTRFADWHGWAEEVALDGLPLTDAIAFLQDRAEMQDEAGATALAESLGKLPLALDHVGAYCRRTRESFTDCATNIASRIALAPRGTSYPRSVTATFGLAIDEAIELCPAADALITYLAYCGPERIPLALINGAATEHDESSAALLALVEVSLAKQDPFIDGTPAVTVHRLVQTVARARAEVTSTATSARRRMLSRLLEITPRSQVDSSNVLACTRIVPHAEAYLGVRGFQRSASSQKDLWSLEKPWEELVTEQLLVQFINACYTAEINRLHYEAMSIIAKIR